MDWRTSLVLLVFVAGSQWIHVDSTCVWDSDFGFTLNCGFKKSGIFRVRNLGGVKGYLGLGFSVGDELGFPQSLSTEDNAKRRSTKSSGVGSVPAANAVLPKVEKTTNELGVQTVTTVNGVSKGARSMSGGYRPALERQVTIPPFKPIQPAPPSRPPRPTLEQYQEQHLMAAPAIMVGNNNSRPSRLAYVGPLESLGTEPMVPPFQALPASITRLSSSQTPVVTPLVGVKVVSAHQAFRNTLQAATNRFQVRHDTMAPGYDHGLSTNSLTLRSGPPSAPQQQVVQVVAADPPLPQIVLKPEDSVMGHSIKALAQASNLSVEAITAAIAVRQQQLLKQQQQAMLAATTSPKPITLPPGGVKKYALSGVNKVMNAPKEYYPVGYDKNFDDNFASRVELPDTSFYCGDQKHFPGLYSDEDLGCMVFHVCAFTDDGLIMKSFLCPESTLFDQTILKCNWWFYVDCKSSKKLYDSNIPISKSYQLMKALAFFSAYKKQS